ncbi:unnamed protein product [Ambrosiozyma monospora]|uniref:Unnamed protein product n=1 Tax=Ambrosiozyma monospora TaxID=43982 RepID=A0ACB5T2B5_AMBMO|nr:unnamed protein product [Ambrosiozyma monospora]
MKPDLSYYCELLGLQLSEYRVTTKDGFIISLYHLVDPSNGTPNKKPVLLLHGLLQSCGAYITSGTKSIAYMLVKNNYNVWLANNRCGFEPRHTVYTKDDPEMWDWDLSEMAKFDLTRLIDEVLNITKWPGKLSLIGHSQGTAQITLLVSKEMDLGYNDKIDNVILLSPAIYGGVLLDEKLFIKFIKGIPNSVYNVFFGFHAFMPIMMSLRNIIVGTPIFGFCSYTMFSFLFDWDDHLWDPKIRTVHFMFSPVYVSAKLMKWWLSNKHGQGFQGGVPILKAPGNWFHSDCPKMMLVVGGKDNLVNGDLFINKLYNEENMKDRFIYRKLDEYSHLDVLWADDVLERIGGDMLHFLSSE